MNNQENSLKDFPLEINTKHVTKQERFCEPRKHQNYDLFIFLLSGRFNYEPSILFAFHLDGYILTQRSVWL